MDDKHIGNLDANFLGYLRLFSIIPEVGNIGTMLDDYCRLILITEW